MKKALLSVLCGSLVAAPSILSADPDAGKSTEVPGRWTLDFVPDGKGLIDLDPKFPNIIRTYSSAGFHEIEFNKDATSKQLLLGSGASVGKVEITLDTAEKTTQLTDGTILFSALDAKVDGMTAKLESHPGNHRIGFWSNLEDRVIWNYKASRWGSYSVEMTYSLASGESEVDVVVAGKTVKAKLKATGSWYRYRTVSIGDIYLEKAGKMTLEVNPTKKTGGAVMNLKAVILSPTIEGKAVVQKGAEAIELDSSAATVHGVMLRYEPKDIKRCLGFWANPKDWASWDFEVVTPGKYEVELTQGCGKGQGGSEVTVVVDDGATTMDFTVEDTGGFQNWLPRNLGTVELKEKGMTRIEVRPKNKKRGAVMDIRRIRLLPVAK